MEAQRRRRAKIDSTRREISLYDGSWRWCRGFPNSKDAAAAFDLMEIRIVLDN
jgi:hypothetical protein